MKINCILCLQGTAPELPFGPLNASLLNRQSILARYLRKASSVRQTPQGKELRDTREKAGSRKKTAKRKKKS